jgi:hypothetical protein
MRKRTGIARTRAGVIALVMTSVRAVAGRRAAVEQAERGAAELQNVDVAVGGWTAANSCLVLQ